MSIKLSDDGTLDTVLVCMECGAEFRFNFEPNDPDCTETQAEEQYDEFVDWAIAETEADHECETTTEIPVETMRDIVEGRL